MADAIAEEVIAYEPDRTLRELIGETVRLAEVFTHERIAAGQQEVTDSRAAFFDKVADDVIALEDLLVINPVLPEDGEGQFEEISARAVNIKGPAGQFGYALISAIAGHILDHCEPGEHTPMGRYLIVKELIKFLRVAVQQRVTDEKGTIGRELRVSLQKY